MVNISLTALFEALDMSCRNALETAAVSCAAQGGYEITIDDYVEALLSLETMKNILIQFDRSVERILELVKKNLPHDGRNTNRPAFSQQLYQWLQEAYLVATLELRQERIDAGALVMALLQNPLKYRVFPFYKELKEISIDNLCKLLVGLQAEEKLSSPNPSPPTTSGALDQYTIDFIGEAKAGKIDPVFARGPEIRLMIDILTRRRKNNPILVGDPGVGKTAVVEGLALKILEGTVPDALKGVRIVGLDMGRLQAGASVKGEFEKRLKAVIDDVKSAPCPTILFIDEAHTLVGSGNDAGSGDAANLLKPALARGEMRTIAATTWSEYKKYFEKDAALARRFQLVKLNEPSLEETITILRGIVPHYEKNHQVYVRDDAVIRTVELAGRYMSGRQLPDKAIDVLDTACARVRVSISAKPPILEAKEEKLAAMRRELDALERDLCNVSIPNHTETTPDRHALLWQECSDLSEEIETIQTQWRQERELVMTILHQRASQTHQRQENFKYYTEGHEDSATSQEQLISSLRAVQADSPLVFYEVNPDLVTGIVAEWTGIPVGKLRGSGSEALTTLNQRLRSRIRGQNHALETIEEAILASQIGLEDPCRPTGIFLLVGPSGVGKTETTLAIADELFGGERMLIGINMSEFQEKHTISRLIGSPPGYVGYGEGGRLTEAVRRQPYSVILFDEVEKAHPDVLNLFYQIFDKGILTDGEGREVDFRNTMIFMTSNLAGDVIASMFEDSEEPSFEEVHKAIRPTLSKFFRPALLGRMAVIPFLPIRRDILQELVVMKLTQVEKRMTQRHRMRLTWTDDVVTNIAASCTAVDTGARNIDHIINAGLLPQITPIILKSLTESSVALRDLHIDIDKSTGHFLCSSTPGNVTK